MGESIQANVGGLISGEDEEFGVLLIDNNHLLNCSSSLSCSNVSPSPNVTPLAMRMGTSALPSPSRCRMFGGVSLYYHFPPIDSGPC